MIRFLTYMMLALLPTTVTFGASAPNDFKGFVGLVVDFINMLVGFLLAILFVVVVWGIIDGWVIHGGDEKGVEKGKSVIIAGIIAFVVIVSFWGIVNLVKSSFFG